MHPAVLEGIGAASSPIRIVLARRRADLDVQVDIPRSGGADDEIALDARDEAA
jgi:hypothetical protein